MKDKLNITIRIAELPPFALQIDRSEEEMIRNAEYNVNKLWRTWRQRFTDKSSTEVLGMVAFQFAKLFTVLNRQADETAAVLDRFERQLDSILLDIDALGADGNMTLPDAGGRHL
ncbi:MAG: cell division protein ZapA [Muribaculaceae bacterium]|nr:cell division protein ZapA [Muribaculaceae bacterium]MDE6346116.1 cell division protein ZapA [Muribaculaceae bacterium]